MRRLPTLLFVPLLLLPSIAIAAESDEVNIEPMDEAADKVVDATAPAPADDKKNQSGKTEEFTPSEEISEDFAVSFPVDI